jgi:hypothetical protein
VLQRIETLVKAAAPGDWIVTMPLGDPPYYFDVPGSLREKRFPTRRDLDRVAPRNLVYIRAIWGYWRHTLPLVSIANSARHRAAVGWDTDRKGSGRRADMLHDSASDAVLSPLGIGFTSASCRAYMTMNGVISASVSAVSSQQVAKVTCTPHVIVPLGSAPLAIALVESSASRIAGTTIRNL